MSSDVSGQRIKRAMGIVSDVRRETGRAGWDLLVPRVQRALIAERVFGQLVLGGRVTGTIHTVEAAELLADCLDVAGLEE